MMTPAMRRTLTVLAVFALVALPVVVAAADPIGGGTAIKIDDIKRLVKQIVQTLITVASLAVVGYLVYGGMKMAMSAGNDADFKKGKDIVRNAIIGGIVIFGVGVIVATISSFATDPTSITQ